MSKYSYLSALRRLKEALQLLMPIVLGLDMVHNCYYVRKMYLQRLQVGFAIKRPLPALRRLGGPV
jgi:hypothetical protein